MHFNRPRPAATLTHPDLVLSMKFKHWGMQWWSWTRRHPVRPSSPNKTSRKHSQGGRSNGQALCFRLTLSCRLPLVSSSPCGDMPAWAWCVHVIPRLIGRKGQKRPHTASLRWAACLLATYVAQKPQPWALKRWTLLKASSWVKPQQYKNGDLH